MDKYKDIVLRLNAIFDAAVDGIIIIDDKGIIEKVNSATCFLFGYPEGELIGQNVKC
ncbi:MAG: PAS domain S-box protein [Saprospiraceae bacterium]|nr:PAS domain S-box protein [Saprospiraceae bacterium]